MFYLRKGKHKTGCCLTHPAHQIRLPGGWLRESTSTSCSTPCLLKPIIVWIDGQESSSACIKTTTCWFDFEFFEFLVLLGLFLLKRNVAYLISYIIVDFWHLIIYSDLFTKNMYRGLPNRPQVTCYWKSDQAFLWISKPTLILTI